MGGGKKKLLRELPQKFDRFLAPNKVDMTKSLWEVSTNQCFM